MVIDYRHRLELAQHPLVCLFSGVLIDARAQRPPGLSAAGALMAGRAVIPA
jgi:hypothetical protein